MLKRSLAMLLLAVPLIAAPVEPEPVGDVKAEQKKLQGTWSIVKGTREGMPAPKEMMMSKFTFDGDKIKISGGPGGREEPAVTYTINPKKKPGEIDIQPPKGEKVVHGIYKWDKEEFIMVFSNPGQPRPTTFDDKKASMLQLKRDKK